MAQAHDRDRVKIVHGDHKGKSGRLIINRDLVKEWQGIVEYGEDGLDGEYRKIGVKVSLSFLRLEICYHSPLSVEMEVE